jgi:hypothetical protein
MITLLFIAIAAACNAVMDRTENAPAFNKSVFNHFDVKFWLKEVSWQYASKILRWKFDSWHVAKSLMVIFLAMAIILQTPILGGVFDFIIYISVWNLTFNLFYNKILVD